MKQASIKCPYCGAGALLRPATIIPEKSGVLRSGKVYVCARYPLCDAYVSAHTDTGLPMGTLANAALRRKRQEAHRAFDQLWKSGLMSRKEAYRWLQTQLGLPEAEAHISNFSEFRCQQVIHLAKRFMDACAGAA